MLPKVFRVLCALEPKGHQYQKPLLEQMLLLKFHELQGTPTWSLLRKIPSFQRGGGRDLLVCPQQAPEASIEQETRCGTLGQAVQAFKSVPEH